MTRPSFMLDMPVQASTACSQADNLRTTHTIPATHAAPAGTNGTGPTR